MKRTTAILIAALLLGYCSVKRVKTRPSRHKEKTQPQVSVAEKKATSEAELPIMQMPEALLESPAVVDRKFVLKRKEEKVPLRPANLIRAEIERIVRAFGYKGDFKIPESFEKRVAYYVWYFTEHPEGSSFFRRAMQRGERYLPFIIEVFTRKGLPTELAFLPLVESGFNPYARSRAGAVGLWQFMRSTARRYGLRVSRRVDERKDPYKSTIAAAEYLNDLLAMFGVEDPFLGISAYNAGEQKVLSALRKISYRERSFWSLVRYGYLKRETEEFVPKFIASIIVARNPQLYAKAGQLQKMIEEVKARPEPSPQLRRLQAQRRQVRKTEAKAARRSYITYRVRRGDTLWSIARRYGVTVSQLKRWNRLRSNRIYPGQRLKIYTTRKARAKKPPARGYKIVYTVNYTDSLARIALMFKGVTIRDIMRWNNLKHTRIYPRQKLVLYLKYPPKKVVIHTVKRGETAWDIARKYGVRVEYILSLNGLVTDSKLRPGMKLKIYYFK